VSDGGSTSRCTEGRRQSRRAPRSAGAWISCMMHWPTGGRFGSSRSSISGGRLGVSPRGTPRLHPPRQNRGKRVHRVVRRATSGRMFEREQFASVADAQAKIEAWRVDSNRARQFVQRLNDSARGLFEPSRALAAGTSECRRPAPVLRRAQLAEHIAPLIDRSAASRIDLLARHESPESRRETNPSRRSVPSRRRMPGLPLLPQNPLQYVCG
jgi:hypothetical protein